MTISRGSTLLEIGIALLIFTLLMLLGASFFLNSDRSFVRAKQDVFAVTFGSGVVERIGTMPWNNLISTQTSTAGPCGVTFTCLSEVITKTAGSSRYKVISTTVTWPQQDMQVSFETMVSSTTVR